MIEKNDLERTSSACYGSTTGAYEGARYWFFGLLVKRLRQTLASVLCPMIMVMMYTVIRTADAQWLFLASVLMVGINGDA